MKLAVASAIIAALASGTASADRMSDFRYALDTCAGETVAALDDGVTPADTVGRVLLGQCLHAVRPLYHAAIAGHSRAWVEGFNGAAQNTFTGYVLWHRAQIRKQRH